MFASKVTAVKTYILIIEVINDAIIMFKIDFFEIKRINFIQLFLSCPENLIDYMSISLEQNSYPP